MKQLEISKLSKQDLEDKLLDYKKQLSDLKMNHAISPLENPLQIKIVRRVIARINTALNNKDA